MLGSCEHDTLSLCLTIPTGSDRSILDCPAATSAAVDASIELFARLLPIQDLPTVTRTVTQLVESVKSPKLDKNSGRKAALLINSVVAIARALRCAMESHSRQAKETLGHSQVTTPLAFLLKVVSSCSNSRVFNARNYRTHLLMGIPFYDEPAAMP